jgi:hypothetical protein
MFQRLHFFRADLKVGPYNAPLSATVEADLQVGLNKTSVEADLQVGLNKKSGHMPTRTFPA